MAIAPQLASVALLRVRLNIPFWPDSYTAEPLLSDVSRVPPIEWIELAVELLLECGRPWPWAIRLLHLPSATGGLLPAKLWMKCPPVEGIVGPAWRR
jgi:hypothetical protein